MADLQARYAKLLQAAKQAAPNPATEVNQIPLTVMAITESGQLCIGRLMTDSIYHFYVVKNFNPHVSTQFHKSDATAALSFFGSTSVSRPETPRGTVSPTETEPSEFGFLQLALCLCAVFLLSRLAVLMQGEGYAD